MCANCGQHRPFQKAGVGHLLHFFISIFTVGFWIPVWILCVILNAFRRYRCQFCGKGKY